MNKMGQKLKIEDLLSLEEYDQKRDEFRKKIIKHKKNRIMYLGDHISIHFEDRLTMQYQIQEILRAERIFERKYIEKELNAYNLLISNSKNLKVTFMIEYENIIERKKALSKMIGIENKVWLKTIKNNYIYSIADEDLDKKNQKKTSSVHFLKFKLTDEFIQALKEKNKIFMGINHPFYFINVEVPHNIKKSLNETLI